MTHLHYKNGHDIMLDYIQYSVVSLSYAPFFVTLEAYGSFRKRVLGKTLDALYNLYYVRLGYRRQILFADILTNLNFI
jgi:hypothetical protein